MAKRDDNIDPTPIEFRISNSATGRGPRIPVPINQPHWKYKKYKQTRPTIVEWILVIFFALTMLTIGILIWFTSNAAPVKWIFSITLISSSVGIVYHLLWRETSQRSNDDLQEEKQPRKREKKQPKYRKDYK